MVLDNGGKLTKKHPSWSNRDLFVAVPFISSLNLSTVGVSCSFQLGYVMNEIYFDHNYQDVMFKVLVIRIALSVTGLGGCRLSTWMNRGNFVDWRTCVMYIYVTGTIKLSQSF